MKYYSYIEPDDNDDSNAIKIIMTEQEIIEQYWEHWHKEMKELGRDEHISIENCIADFCSAHWASEEPVYKFKTGHEGLQFCVNELHPLMEHATLACVNNRNVTVTGYVHIEDNLERVYV
jgi:hypothetical protein